MCFERIAGSAGASERSASLTRRREAEVMLAGVIEQKEKNKGKKIECVQLGACRVRGLRAGRGCAQDVCDRAQHSELGSREEVVYRAGRIFGRQQRQSSARNASFINRCLLK